MNNREIDRLIAEKVMGWEVKEIPSKKFLDAYVLYKRPNQSNINDHQWNPSTYIQDAWQIVEKFDFASVDRITGYGEFYNVTLSVAEEDGTYSEVEAKADTAPMAICLAALKAVGIEVK